ncbi:MAG: FtsX-like permease family protein [Chitinivibrionales bacterium]|nr:FtsX-like permease family protein [Chitinivibrionales bacterium]
MPKIAISILVGIKMSLIEMRSHFLRSALSILGVLFGVASLVAMLTLIGGIDKFLNSKMSRWLGTIWVWQKNAPEDADKVAWSRSPGMRFSDGNYLADNAEEVGEVARYITRRERIYILGKRARVKIKAVDSAALAVDFEHIEIEGGRWFTPEEYERGAQVCLLPWHIEERIQKQLSFSANRESSRYDLLHKHVVYENTRLQIIGIFGPKNPEDRYRRRTLFIPIKTMQKYIVGFDPNPGSIEITVSDVEKLEEETKKIAQSLAAHHRGVEDFEYNTAERVEEMRTMLNNISVIMTIISLISLLVGGLSIMNVMLSSISERIHEIGVRMALGAKRLQIFIQFVAETTTLSLLGGLLGIPLGVIPLYFKEAIAKSTEGAVEPTILLSHIIYVVTIIISVGIIFGLYPAIKASRMSPIEALRYE